MKLSLTCGSTHPHHQPSDIEPPHNTAHLLHTRDKEHLEFGEHLEDSIQKLCFTSENMFFDFIFQERIPVTFTL